MVNLVIIGIVLVILAVIIFIVIPAQASAFINSLKIEYDRILGQQTARDLEPRVQSDETICDLRIKVHAQITQDLGIGSPEITIDSSNPRTYDWFNCDKLSSMNFLNFYDFNLDKTPPTIFYIDGKPFTESSLEKFDFISFGGESISTEIVLRDRNDSTQKIDAFTQPQLFRLIEIPEGLVKTPLDASIEFVVTNIPHRDYTLEIYYGRSINDMEAGDPLLSEVCQIGKATC